MIYIETFIFSLLCFLSIHATIKIDFLIFHRKDGPHYTWPLLPVDAQLLRSYWPEELIGASRLRWDAECHVIEILRSYFSFYLAVLMLRRNCSDYIGGGDPPTPRLSQRSSRCCWGPIGQRGWWEHSEYGGLELFIRLFSVYWRINIMFLYLFVGCYLHFF